VCIYCDCCSLRPWDCMNDVVQYERDFVIQTKTRHQTPIVHTTSVIAGSTKDEKTAAGRTHSRHSSMDHTPTAVARSKRMSLKHARDPAQENAGTSNLFDSESSLSAGMLFCSHVFLIFRFLVLRSWHKWCNNIERNSTRLSGVQ